jgi:hypothetical protein
LLIAGIHEKQVGEKTDWISTAGSFFVFSMSVFTVWGGLNSLAVYFQRQLEFDSFGGILAELQSYREECAKRDTSGAADKSNEEHYNGYSFILVDYCPRIGQISAPRIAERIVRVLKQIGLENDAAGKCHIIMSDDQELVRFNTVLLSAKFEGQEDRIKEECKSLLQQITEDIKQLEDSGFSVWRSKKIYSEHYIVSGKRASQYLVIPDRLGQGNKINGESTTAKRRIDFLRDAAMGYLIEAITPTIEKDKLVFHTSQDKISAIEIVAETNGEVKHKISINDGHIEAGTGYAVSGVNLPSRFRIRLVKKIGNGGGDAAIEIRTPESEVVGFQSTNREAAAVAAGSNHGSERP